MGLSSDGKRDATPSPPSDPQVRTPAPELTPTTGRRLPNAIGGLNADFWGGLGLMAMALSFLVITWELDGYSEFGFGPGTAPRLFAGLLLLLAAILVARAVRQPMNAEAFALRGPLVLAFSILVFALTIERLGLALSSFMSYLIAASASHEFQFVSSLVWSVLVTILIILLFSVGLGMSLRIIPDW